ncbi:F-box only protein 33-like [Patiria miniata]|uniref:F-box domain-containing protein n=1 Tax=Patiria miniata TaxID=46514 RepID=A0A914BB60_PATMI|nr:F-box only protein 33-like [Patiria miniata]XP_038073295.1 F-box only protein 33-like [Patiria miniata]XP_038073296.1 F-box only protein 33-like [Patiria miniata]
MEPSNWSQLPHTAVVNMFSHLSHRDRARASSTCKSWRDCYFHPSFWRRVDLELTFQTGCEPARCILDKCGKFVRELCLTCTVALPVLCAQFANRDASGSAPPPTGSEESSQENQPDDLLRYRKLYQDLPTVFQGLHNSEGLEKLIFCFFPLCKNCNCGAQLPGEEFGTKMTESLKKVIQASTKLKTLALAHNSGSLRSTFLKELSDKFGKQLRVLHIPTFQVAEEVTDEAITLTSSLSNFTSLSILTLNLSMVTDQLLKGLPDSKCASTLRQLNMVIGFGADVNSYLDDSSWSKLGRRLPDLQVTVSAIISDYGATDELLHYLTPSIPLTSLRIFVSQPWSLKEDLIDSIAKNYSKSLSCLEIHTDKSALFFGNNSEADPLVMLCWQCKKLNRLVITGYKLLICNVLAIATLRGPGLSTFEVERGLLYSDHDEMWASEEYDEETPTSHDSFYSDGTVSDSPTSETEYRFTLIQDISSSLKRPWEPVERRHMTIPKFLTQDLLIDADQ